MQNRRDFIKQASMLMAGGVVAPHVLSSFSSDAAKSSKYLGLQLYSLRDMVKDEGIQKVLQVASKLGYNNLEAASYGEGKFYDIAPAEFKKMVDDLGMKLISSHVSREITDNRSADMAWWNKAVEAHNIAGMKYMVMPSSPLNSRRGATIENLEQYCDYFNEIGKITATASIQFGYHNHDGEFKNQINGKPVFDLMLENTSPPHVFFQADVYWVKMGGYDPVDYMKKYPNRIKVLHIKDEKAIGVHNVVDFKAVYDQAYANGIKDWFVEVEQYDGTPEQDVKKSADYLRKAKFVK
jgi:sugar phosphate isomerase/epimerase